MREREKESHYWISRSVAAFSFNEGKIYFYAITAGWIQAAINIELPMRKIRTTLFTRIQDLYPVIRMRYSTYA